MALSGTPREETDRYLAEHFDVYVGDLFERAVGDQLAFLAQHLLASPAAEPEPLALP